VTDVLEPGSTMKTITIAGALEAGLTRPDEPFYCENGSYKIGPATIHDDERIGDTTLTGVLAQSSNICTAKIAARQGRERLRDMMIRFGFGKPTGVDLPGERAGQVRAVAKMGPVETATMAFGQGVTVTPLQLAAAYAAIANGGTLYRPHVARGAPQGSRVIDESLASTLRQLLFAVTQKGGTAQRLLIPGYHFGGKTGTAQKVDPATRRYSADKWAASFVGFAPFDEPRIVLYVMVDEPVGNHHGSTVAGPVFQEVVTDALRWLGVRPTEALPAHPEAVAKTPPPHGKPALDAPAPDEEGAAGEGMPDLRGLGVAEAVTQAAQRGLRLEVVGSGVAVEQGLPPGGDGSTLRVTFRPPG
jgi:cell division protein FtsI (penicillin-binding protein 3)